MELKLHEKNLGLAEIFATGSRIMVNHFEKILVLVCLFFFPLSILQGFLDEKTMGVMDVIISLGAQSDPTELLPAMQVLMKTQMIQMAIQVILVPVGVIALTHVVCTVLKGKEIDVKKIGVMAMNCLGSIVFTGVVFVLLVTLIVVAVTFVIEIVPESLMPAFMVIGIVVMLYFAVVMSFYIPAIGLRDKKGWGALQYGAKLVNRGWGKAIWYYFAFMMMTTVLYWPFGMVIAMIFKTHIAGGILQCFLSYLANALSIICMTIFFLNREGMAFGPIEESEDVQEIIEG